MKNGLLTFVLALLGYSSFAQVIVNVQSPANIAGNYAMTYADPNGGWGCPDLLDPANAITGSLELVDDGTVDDSLGCNALVNNLSGKIAVVYRGTCEFGTKALQAQNAGAIAVMIINNVTGDPVGMAPGADGANVTIPIVMITQLDGSFIRAELDDPLGSDVVVFIGNKNGLFDTDLGFTKPGTLVPNPNTNHNLLAQNGSEFSFRVGAWVYNYGILDQTNASFSAVITNPSSTTIYTNQVDIDLLSGDSTYVEFPVFSNASYPVGKYTLTYTLTTTAADEYDSDNSMVIDFFIADDVYSYVKLDENGLPESTTGYRTSAATSTFSSCIHFRNSNADRVKADGLYFSATTNTNSQLLGQEIILTAYQWDNVFTDLNDQNAAIDLIQELTNTSYVYVDDSMDFKTVYAAFSQPVIMLNDQRYLFCATTFDENTYLGYGNIDYSLVLDEVLQPLFPIQTDDGFNIVGFGGESSSIGIKMSDVNGVGLTEAAASSSVSVYPNPAKGIFHIKGSALADYQQIELRDQLGRLISSWKVNDAGMTLDVNHIAPGNYNLLFSGNNGNVVQKVQIR